MPRATWATARTSGILRVPPSTAPPAPADPRGSPPGVGLICLLPSRPVPSVFPTRDPVFAGTPRAHSGGSVFLSGGCLGLPALWAPRVQLSGVLGPHGAPRTPRDKGTAVSPSACLTLQPPASVRHDWADETAAVTGLVPRDTPAPLAAFLPPPPPQGSAFPRSLGCSLRLNW